jgi:DtxR family Mn-dependent transcriptional regulator
LLAPIVAASITVLPILQETTEKTPVGEPLNVLQPGEKGKVVTLSPRFRGQDRRRMMDLGVLPGTIIEAELESPGGDPTAYRIRGALIALRREQAELIRINRIQEALQ